ncbi:HNH endonuclease [Micromonospora echinospora]
MSRSWKGGSTRAWRRTRALVLLRDGYQCRAHADGWCARVPGVHVCTEHATQVHHTLGRSTTGDDPAHLVAACASCNRHIGDPTAHVDPPLKPVTRW